MFAVAVHAGRTRPDRTLDRFASLLAEADARLLRENGDLRAGFLDDLRHPARTTARATARDFWLFARQWDVDIADIAVPADIWHGTEDRNVPVAHARARDRRQVPGGPAAHRRGRRAHAARPA